MVEDDSKAKWKGSWMVKAAVAYEADDEAHMDGFDDDGLCYD